LETTTIGLSNPNGGSKIPAKVRAITGKNDTINILSRNYINILSWYHVTGTNWEDTAQNQHLEQV
jgi:cAMP phosphodiesterase